eukprot:539026-Rhodomonas_salina.1
MDTHCATGHHRTNQGGSTRHSSRHSCPAGTASPHTKPISGRAHGCASYSHRYPISRRPRGIGGLPHQKEEERSERPWPPPKDSQGQLRPQGPGPKDQAPTLPHQPPTKAQMLQGSVPGDPLPGLW